MSHTPSEQEPPHLTVVIPTHNRRERLRLTLDGLSRQDLPAGEFEVLVVSDGSTDGTPDFVRSYAEGCAYSLRLLTQENSGPSAARNHGVDAARGEVIVFLDDDVEPSSGFLSAHARHHRQDAQVAVIGPMLPDPAMHQREPVWVTWEHTHLQRQYENWRTGVWKGAGPNHFYSGNASVRREHLRAVGGFDLEFKRQEDVELAYRMARERGVHFVFEAAAAGTHRPVRSLQAWLKVPYAYGRLDVVRARRGAASWQLIRSSYYRRSRVTRLMASLSLAVPGVGGAAAALLLSLGWSLKHLRLTRAAVSCLSVIYNTRYLEGVQDELGSRVEVRRLLNPTLALSDF